MTLADLRKISIKQNVRIRFPLSSGGLECVLNEHGVAQIPALRSIPDFNLEEELARALQFTLEPAGAAERGKTKPQILTRGQLAALVDRKPGDAAHDDHDE